MAKSATMPSNSTIRACSLAADEEKMIHEEQLLLRENPQECQNQQHILIMMQLAAARSSLTEVHL
jgi:hypothetical protein